MTDSRRLDVLRSRPFVGLLIAVALVAASCSGGADRSPDDRPAIVVTTTIWGDVVRSVVGDDATITVLVPVGVDPHEYSASASQVASLQLADLVVANGLGLEDGLVDVLDSAKSDGANVLTIADKVEPIPFGKATADGEMALDPHVWFDPTRVAAGAILIAEALTVVDDSIDWHSRAVSYGEELLVVDATVSAELSMVSPESRKLITNHDSLGYLADRYGYQVVGTVIPGGATLSSPSSADLAALILVIEQEDVPAIFAESTEPALLAEAVASEVGHDVAVVDLFTGSLGPDGSGAETLLGLLLSDATLIADALS
jgi:zinc/manganese transport system substrate-binding protein